MSQAPRFEVCGQACGDSKDAIAEKPEYHLTMAESLAAAALANGRAENLAPERRFEIAVNTVETWWARRKKAKKAK
jgi:hypothetical protein